MVKGWHIILIIFEVAYLRERKRESLLYFSYSFVVFNFFSLEKKPSGASIFFKYFLETRWIKKLKRYCDRNFHVIFNCSEP